MTDMKILSLCPKVILAALLLLSGCETEPEFHILEVRGVDAVYNLSRSLIYFGSFAGPDSVVPVVAGNGDLLYMVRDQSDDVVFLRYVPQMGTSLEMKFDSLYPGAIYLNGDLHTVDLKQDTLPPALPVEEIINGLSDVQSIYLKLPLNNDHAAWLENFFYGNRRLNILVEGEDKNDQLAGLLHRLRPEWVVMSDLYWSTAGEDWIKGFKNTRLLTISVPDSGNDHFYTRIPSLVSLILFGKPEEPFPSMSFTGLPNLRNLSLVDASHADISVLDGLSRLESLFFLNIDSFSSEERLAAMTRLKALGLTESSWEDDLPVLPALKWMSLPEDITQDDFSRWCGQHKGIEVLEIISNRTVTDLRPLENLTGLRALSLGAPEASPEFLSELKQLELLVIDHALYDESEDLIARLREALPRTRIVPGGGFCLGSGWILLLLPFLLLMFAAGYKKQK